MANQILPPTEDSNPEAMADLWAEVLAGLRGVDDAQLDRLALKAQALCAEERDQELRAYVENRIDEIVFERRARERPDLGEE